MTPAAESADPITGDSISLQVHESSDAAALLESKSHARLGDQLWNQKQS